MKRSLIILATLLALLIAPTVAFGQVGGGPFTSGIQIVNQGTGAATVTVRYINQDGTEAASQTGPIPAGQSVTFFPLGAPITGWTGGTVPTGFNGSVVIEANQPVTAVSNLASADFKYLDSYNSFAGGDTDVTLPIIQKNNGGYSSWFSVQNVGTADATVNVAYTPGVGQAGTATTEGPFTIKAGAARIFNQGSLAGLGTSFVGNAKVTSNQPVAVVVNQEQAGTPKQISSYTGLGPSEAAATIQLPLIMANNGGFLTGIGVTNVGTASANVTIKFTANTVTGCAQPPDKTVTLAAGAGFTGITQQGFGALTIAGFDNCRYVGSATVSGGTGSSLVAVVNELGGSFLSSYISFTDAEATATVSMPLVQSNNGGFSSAFQLQNLGTAAVSNVTVTYTANTVTSAGACPTPAAVTIASIPAGGSVTVGQAKGFGPDNLVSATFTGCAYVGSATVTGPTGAKLVAIVNQLGGGNDTLLTYYGVNQ